MRLGLVTATAFLALIQIAAADDAQVIVRKSTHIPAESLGAALQTLAKERGFQVVYVSAQVDRERTLGASGQLTVDEALAQLLRGTGLTFRHVADNGVSILPIGSPAASPQSSPANGVAPGRTNEASIPPSGEARAGRGSDAGSATVNDRTEQAVELQEVIVTAQKRQERLQDVPMSISAVTGEEIRAKDVTSIGDMQYSIPGLSISSTVPGQDLIEIGGISNQNGSATVGEYLDEMPIDGVRVQLGAQGQFPDVRLLDMARVEVLRGPQGTLYGQGSMGGTIRYITNSPDLNAYSGTAEVEGGEITDGAQSYKANGVANLPLIRDKLGVRLVAGYERDGGWIDDTATGASNINGTDIKTFRGKLLARPVENLDLSLLYLHQNSDTNFQPQALNGIQSSPVETFNHDRQDLVNGIAKYQLGSVEILESVGYQHRTASFQSDLTSSLLPVLEAPPPFGLGLPPGFITQIPFGLQEHQRIFSDELRFASSSRAPFQWTAGGYYRNGKAEEDDASSTFPGQLPFALLADTVPFTSDSFALFADGTYQLTDQLSASAGARYFHDRETQTSSTVTFGLPGLVALPAASFHSIDPRFNLSYKFSPEDMAYLSAAKGFRTGGFNAIAAAGVPETFQPDELWRYELGTKHQLLSRKLEFAADVSYTDWSQVQTTVLLPPANVIAVTENSGKVSGWGSDLTATARPIEGLTLTGTFGWNNLAYASGSHSALENPGDPVDYDVRKSYSLALDYRRLLFNDTLGFFHADFQHAGEAQLNLRFENNLIVHIPARSLTNLRAGLEFGHFEASVFVTNLTNDRTVLFPIYPGSPPYNEEQRPRTVGVNLRAHF